MRQIIFQHGMNVFPIYVLSDMKLSITSVNGRIDKNHDAVLEAQISLADSSEVDQLIKKLKQDKRIYDVRRTT